MSALPFDQARALVLGKTVASRLVPETVPLSEAVGRTLAEDIHADRDYPPFRARPATVLPFGPVTFPLLPRVCACLAKPAPVSPRASK
ncbi:MAG: hypothetical protein R2748_07650 [Bryobacterales bacterium]